MPGARCAELSLPSLSREHGSASARTSARLVNQSGWVDDAFTMNAQTLTIQVPASFCQLVIAPALPRLLVAHPELRVTMIEDGASADAAVCIGPVDDDGRVIQELGVVRPVTCASAECVERAGTPQMPSDLPPGDCIALLEPRTRRPQPWTFRRGNASLTIAPAGALAFADPQSAVAVAVRGGGYIRVRSFEAEQQIAAGVLRTVLTDWNDLPLRVTLVRPRDRIVRAEVAVFGEFVAGLLPGYDRSNDSSAAISTGFVRCASNPAATERCLSSC
jgi:DNA-binding transcriptional LysR family regulator